MPKLAQMHHDFPEPDPTAITMADPRPSRAGSDLGIVAFVGYTTTPGKEEPVDAICGGAVLSNFWDLSPGFLELTAPDEPGTPKSFRNAEAAFHALKFWKVGDSFALASASQVWGKFRKLSGNEDSTYSGFGSDWKAMMAVLTAKFASDPRVAATLLKTGDAFLLYHTTATGRDSDWSNNYDGVGQNLLGMQLMLVRDCFSGRDVWTEYLQGIVDAQTGIYLGPVRKQKWQDIVQAATIRVLDEAWERDFNQKAPPNMPICSRRGCGRPIWNNQPDSNYCGTCREEMKREEAALAAPGGISSQDALRAIGDVASVDSPFSPVSPPSPGSPVSPWDRRSGKVSARKDQPQPHQAVAKVANGVDNERLNERPQLHRSNTPKLHRSTTLATVDQDMSDMRLLFHRASSFVATSPPPPHRTRSGLSGEALSSYADEDEHIDVNRPGILPTLLFACLWVGMTVAVLFAILWVYVYEGVRRHEDMATQAAVAHARLAVAELLGPAETVYKVLGAAFGGGAVAGLSDYAGLARALAPHFAARPAIHEVELAGPPEEYAGSVHAAAEGKGVRLRTDRADCERAGLHGCALEAMRTNSSGWYKTGFGIGNAKHEAAPLFFWHGPTYSPVPPPEPVCGDFCWRPTYAFVGKTRSGRPVETPPADVTTTLPPKPPAPLVLVRAGVDVQVLRTVVLTAEALCRCVALLATWDGMVVAAADMAQTLSVDNMTGEVHPARAWELSYDWSHMATKAFVRKANSRHTFVTAGIRVSSWSLGGGPSDALGLGSGLRIVLAVPEGAFFDAVLGPLVPWMTLTAVMPLATVILSTLAAGFLKCVVYGWRRHKEAILISSFRD